MSDKIIYFDSAAKSIPYKDVIDTYNESLNTYFANPSSIHIEGVKGNRAIEKTKAKILSIMGLQNHKMIFVSTATEGNNLAIKGYVKRYSNRGNHLITSSYEHPSVLEVFHQLEKDGFNVTYLNPNSDGVISPEQVASAITDKTILVSVMAVNNEIGSVNDVDAIGRVLSKYPKIVFHTDASQAVGKVDEKYANADLITISSHKIHGLPTGGALFIKNNLELVPLNAGGGQEFNMRSGTVDLASLSAFACALEKSLKDKKKHYDDVKVLRDKLVSYLLDKKDLYELNSTSNNPYIVNFSTITKKGSVVVEALSRKGILVSSTSACSSYKQKGSYVVASLGKDENVSNNTIRISFSYLNTVDEVETLINKLDSIIGEIK